VSITQKADKTRDRFLKPDYLNACGICFSKR